jgi:hypothetical protein
VVRSVSSFSSSAAVDKDANVSVTDTEDDHFRRITQSITKIGGLYSALQSKYLPSPRSKPYASRPDLIRSCSVHPRRPSLLQAIDFGQVPHAGLALLLAVRSSSSYPLLLFLLVPFWNQEVC